jgi:D-arginine dehydrogenase
MAESFDIAIAGAGMAGASLAAALGGKASVLLLEAEAQPGYHATGRSAAFWTESYGGPGVLPLTAASGPFLRAQGLLSPRGALTLGRTGDEREIERFAARFEGLGVRVELLEPSTIEARIPGLRGGLTCAAYEPDCCDIDVAGLHALYLAQARNAGVQLWCNAGLARAEHGSRWQLHLANGREAHCDVLVNAAGAWADPRHHSHAPHDCPAAN